jgi:hypothetical protein
MEKEFEYEDHPWDLPSEGDIEYIPLLYQAMYNKAIELTEREIKNGNVSKDSWQQSVDLHLRIMVVLHSDICSIGIGNNDCTCSIEEEE